MIVLLALVALGRTFTTAAEKLNIVWIVSEDNSIH